MSEETPVANVYRLAEEIDRIRRTGADAKDVERNLIAFLRQHQAELEPVLSQERDLFYTYPGRWEDMKLLADSGLEYYLASIREFNCEGWPGDELPPEFFLMKNLVNAWLSGTDLESIGGNYSALTHLEKLVAEEVWTLRYLEDPSVAEAPRIQEVCISACELEVFPSQLYTASTLTALRISYCRSREYLTHPFSTIPNGISQLKQLKNLDLAGIGLTHVPLELYEMTWLEQLNLLSNELLPLSEQTRLRAALPNTKILLDPV